MKILLLVVSLFIGSAAHADKLIFQSLGSAARIGLFEGLNVENVLGENTPPTLDQSIPCDLLRSQVNQPWSDQQTSCQWKGIKPGSRVRIVTHKNVRLEGFNWTAQHEEWTGPCVGSEVMNECSFFCVCEFIMPFNDVVVGAVFGTSSGGPPDGTNPPPPPIPQPDPNDPDLVDALLDAMEELGGRLRITRIVNRIADKLIIPDTDHSYFIALGVEYGPPPPPEALEAQAARSDDVIKVGKGKARLSKKKSVKLKVKYSKKAKKALKGLETAEMRVTLTARKKKKGAIVEQVSKVFTVPE